MRSKFMTFLIKNVKLLIAILAFMTAITPYACKYIDSVRMGVKFGSVDLALEQKRLWETNIDCVSTSTDRLQIIRQDNSKIAVLVCPTGDMLIELDQPMKGRFFRWVGLNSIQLDGAKAQVISGSSVKQLENIKQKIYQQVDDVKIIIIDEEINGECFRSWIFAYSGEVIRRAKIDCKDMRKKEVRR